MKKSITLLMSLVLLGSLTACGAGTTDGDQKTATGEKTETPKEEPVAKYPALADLAGEWDGGSMVINDIIVSDEIRALAEAGELEGCNLEEIEKAKGQSNPFNFILEPTGEDSGTMRFDMEDEEADVMEFTYKNGVIEGTMVQDEMEGVTEEVEMKSTMKLEVSEEDDKYVAKGTFSIEIAMEEGKIGIETDLDNTKTKGGMVTEPTDETDEEAVMEDDTMAEDAG